MAIKRSGNIGVGNTLTPSVELIGDWDKLEMILSTTLPLAVKLGAEAGRTSAANKIQALIKKNIRNNGVRGTYWPEYSMRYEERKARMGGNLSTFYRFTDAYYDNIKVIKKSSHIMVGLPQGVKGRVNTKNPLNLTDIAKILERGSEAHNIAARPLWGPTFKEFGGKKRISYHMVFHIRQKILLLTGMKAKVSIPL